MLIFSKESKCLAINNQLQERIVKFMKQFNQRYFAPELVKDVLGFIKSTIEQFHKEYPRCSPLPVDWIEQEGDYILTIGSHSYLFMQYNFYICRGVADDLNKRLDIAKATN